MILTRMVPAASGGASSPPAALKHPCGPKAGGVLTENIWSQITNLQPGELTQKLLEGHPDTETDTLHRLHPAHEALQVYQTVQTYQNSPSSILQSISSFSAASMEFHSEELTRQQNRLFSPPL